MNNEKGQWSPAELAAIRAALTKVLESPSFSAATRLQDLLRYLVTESLEGRGDRLSQTSIAIDVQGKGAGFDPAVDSQVRVEAGRLRAKLREYYEEDGRGDEIRFELPKGLYQPRIRFAKAPGSEDATPLPGPLPQPLPDAAFLPPEPAQHLPEAAFLPPQGDVRPEPIDESLFPSSTRGRVLGAFFVLLSLAIAAHLALQQKPAEQKPVQIPAPPAPPAAQVQPTIQPTGTAKSLAVLPFANSSAAQENAGFFADGLHDDLLTQLTKIADLKVISRTSVMGYRESPKPVPQIAEELGVRAVLEGAVQRAGDRVRVNVQLIDGRTDQHIWAQSFDQELTATNIFEIQRRIALEIASALQAKLSPQEEQRLAVLPTHNFEAYELYLRARQKLEQRSLDDMTAGGDLYQQAIDQDPTFALAYVGLAESAYLRSFYGGIDKEAMLKIARPALEKAFTINDQIGEAWTMRGALLALEGETDAAKEAYKRAIALNPNYARAWQWYSNLLLNEPEHREEALKLAQRAKELDPLSPLLRVTLGQTYELLGQEDQAVAEYKSALDLDPNFSVAISALGYNSMLARSDVPAGLKLLASIAKEDKNLDAIAGMSLGYQLLGDLHSAAKWGARFIAATKDPGSQALERAFLAYGRGDEAAAAKDAQVALDSNTGKNSFVHGALISMLRNDYVHSGRLQEARDKILKELPELGGPAPKVTQDNYVVAIDFALIQQKLGHPEAMKPLLDGAETVIAKMPRLGIQGFGLADVEIAALRGDHDKAIANLRRAVEEGWIFYWADMPQLNPNLDTIRDDPDYQRIMKGVQERLAEELKKVREMEKSGELALSPLPSGEGEG